MSFLKKITDTVSKGVTTATEKAQQTVEVTRLNAQISGKRKEIVKLFAKIGESVYDGYSMQNLTLNEERINPLCEGITVIRNEIIALNNRIKEIRNEKDCVCGKRLPEDTRFCPSCGHPFPEPIVVEEEPVLEESYASIDVDAELDDHDEHADNGEVGKTVSPVDTRQICQSCETPLYADSHFCPSCGQSTR